MVLGYHIYEEIWDASIGNELLCAREPINPRDPFAVGVVKSFQVISNLRFQSAPCGLGRFVPG